MANLRDKLGVDPPDNNENQQEINVDIICEICFAPSDKVMYNKNATLSVKCIKGHEFIVSGDWSWMING